MKYPKSFENIIDGFARLPGVGYKTAERMAFQVLEMNSNDLTTFANSLLECQHKVHKCPKCFHITESEECEICSSLIRDKSIICVVSSSKDVYAIEKTEGYKGLYHVLGGVLSPSNGVGPEDLSIDQLINRIDSSVKEVILATNPTTEGEMTALYISKLLANKNITISRIAYGVPMGANLDYTDPYTITMAIEGRKIIK